MAPRPPGEDGWPFEKLFDGAKCAYFYDDLVLMPGHATFEASNVEVSGRITKTIALRSPLVAGPEGTTTEVELATALALAGGIGILHCNQGAEQQSAMVRKVKLSMSSFILEPLILAPDHMLEHLDTIREKSGCCTAVVTSNGELGGILEGIVTSRDVDSIGDRRTRIADVMTPLERLVFAKEPIDYASAVQRMREARVAKLPIVDENNGLVCMVTRSDVKRLRQNPLASVDSHGHLLVGAAVGGVAQEDWDRAVMLIEAGADVISVDVCTGGTGDEHMDFISRLKAAYPTMQVLAGPVSTCRRARRLAAAGADGIRVGKQPTGMDEAIVGRVEATAVFEVSRYMRVNFPGLPVLADGGINDSGQAVKALALGASAVVCSTLSAVDEAAGRLIVNGSACSRLSCTGERLRATPLAEPDSASHPQKPMPVLVASLVPGSGTARTFVPYLIEGVRNGMRDLGAESLAALHGFLDDGTLRGEFRSAGSVKVCDVEAEALRRASHPEVMVGY
mmetsp:Transcript_7038/g.15155  ORF Transcript_7038/g.15155 Transcript_7038/m.15155 type:complete len:508 (+) Transcript_7038:70-1593(+)